MLDEIRNIKSTREDLKKFGLTVGVVLFLLGALFFWREKSFYPFLLLAGALCILAGIAVPVILKPLQKLWMAVSIVLGWFMTRLILSVLFYMVFTPLGFTLRLLGRRFLELGWQESSSSYWNYRKPKKFNKGDYEKQF